MDQEQKKEIENKLNALIDKLSEEGPLPINAKAYVRKALGLELNE